MFGFDPDSYLTNEDIGEQVLTVTILSGEPASDLTFEVTAATDDSSATATATGEVKRVCCTILWARDKWP